MADPRMGSASQDITAYMQGGPIPRPATEMFTMQGDQSNYLEMLARLLDDDEFKRIVAEWHKDKKTGKPDPSAYALEPAYGAASAKGRRDVPTYVQP